MLADENNMLLKDELIEILSKTDKLKQKDLLILNLMMIKKEKHLLIF